VAERPRETAVSNVVPGRSAFLRGAALLVAGAAILGGFVSARGPLASPAADTDRPAQTAAQASRVPVPVPDVVKRYRSTREVAAVAAPVRIEIPSLGIKSDLERVRRHPDGTIDVPRRWDRAAWYAEGARPGQAGAAVVLGHVDSRKGPAVFYRLHALRRGSSILVYRADKSSVRFVVDKVEQHDRDAFPTLGVYFPTLRPTLRLITCGGDYVRSAGGYQANVIVFASLPGVAIRSPMRRGTP
jgi:hypothetical protein